MCVISYNSYNISITPMAHAHSAFIILFPPFITMLSELSWQLDSRHICGTQAADHVFAGNRFLYILIMLTSWCIARPSSTGPYALIRALRDV